MYAQGWALHAASPLPFSSKTARHAWALSYVADGAKLRLRGVGPHELCQMDDALDFIQHAMDADITKAYRLR
eukprot:6456547-Amphidinium_carterae.1